MSRTRSQPPGSAVAIFAAAEHALHLLERRLPLDHCLRRDLAVVVASELLDGVEIDVLVLQRVHQLVRRP